MASARLLLVPVAAFASLATACDDDESTTVADAAVTAAPPGIGATDSASPATTQRPVVAGEITVFAAASLTEAFTDVGSAFTAANPEAKITFGFDASSGLVEQIIQGAPADVFASADTANMDKLTEAGLNDGAPVIFATNRLTIIVPPDNPEVITAIADLTNRDLKVVICDAHVPCGRYAQQVFDRAGVTVTPASLEQNVRGVVTKVTAGEADAGIVYATDVTAAGGAADMVEIPVDINVLAEYPIAAVAGSTDAEVAAAFVEFVTGSEGQAIMSDNGFGPP